MDGNCRADKYNRYIYTSLCTIVRAFNNIRKHRHSILHYCNTLNQRKSPSVDLHLHYKLHKNSDRLACMAVCVRCQDMKIWPPHARLACFSSNAFTQLIPPLISQRSSQSTRPRYAVAMTVPLRNMLSHAFSAFSCLFVAWGKYLVHAIQDNPAEISEGYRSRPHNYKSIFILIGQKSSFCGLQTFLWLKPG